MTKLELVLAVAAAGGWLLAGFWRWHARACERASREAFDGWTRALDKVDELLNRPGGQS